MRTIIASIIIVVLLTISFYTIFACKKKGLAVIAKYPQVSCSSMNDIYGDTLEFYALTEYTSFYEHNADRLTGTLQCFCVNEIAKVGTIDLYDKEYSATAFVYENGKEIEQTQSVTGPCDHYI